MAKIKGWYYDKQLESPLTSATLHANMWWDEDKEEFIKWGDIKGSNGFGPNKNKCDKDVFETFTGVVEGACGYGVDPICTSILNEDFNIAISNTWSDFGGDPLGDAWNQIRGPLSAVANPVLNTLDLLTKENEALQNDANSETSWLRQKVQDAVSWINRKRSGMKDSGIEKSDIVSFLNKALVTNGTRFSYYGGTGVSFGNLGMKFIVFPKIENNKFIEVPEQITKLYPYFIGRIEDFDKATDGRYKKEDDDGVIKGAAKEIANRCFLFQNAPGGYETEMNNVDKIQKGTLKLKIGAFYEISNLVCSDIMLSFSKNMVKNPNTQSISPLFCEVNITLRPATKYSDRMLKLFVGGGENNGSYNETRKSVIRTIKNNLEREKKNLERSISKQNYIIDQDDV